MGHIENKADRNYLIYHIRRKIIGRLKLTGNFCPNHKIALNFRNDVTIFLSFYPIPSGCPHMLTDYM